MQNRLTGLARTWYDNLTTYTHNWDEWKALLIRTFPDHQDFATSLRKLVQRVKGPRETMSQYYFGKLSLLQACKITGKDAVSCVIDGLGDHTLQNGARAGRYDTPENLYTYYLSTLTAEVDTRNGTGFEERNKKAFDGRRFGPKPQFTKRAKPYDKEKRERSGLRCYNCHEEGHTSKRCTKPRRECSHCKLLGHSVGECRRLRSSNSEIKIVSPNNTKDCYFVDCELNGYPLRAYLDTGCSIVTIRESDAKKLSLKSNQTNQTIKGYAGGQTKALGETTVKLTVDLVTAEVMVLIVNDSVQIVPIIIGQTFLNRAGVTMVMRDKQIRLFENHLAVLPDMDELPPRKVAVWAKEAAVIPPHSVAFIEICSPDRYEGDLFIESSTRHRPGKEHSLPSCVTTTRDGIVPIYNAAWDTLKLEKGQLLARGSPCVREQPSQGVSSLAISTCSLTPFQISDVIEHVGSNLSEQQRTQLLSVLNEFRDCFAEQMNELGKTNVTEMRIDLHDNVPVTFRPYRLAHAERMVVRGIVQDLLDNGIIRNSQSPYASPILLVKKKTGDYRMCVDFRALNRKTIKDTYPLPRVDDYLERIQGCHYFTTLDMSAGYHQIKMAEGSVSKTAFITPDGHYEYLRMPFGLVNAPFVFQRAVNSVLGNLRFSTAMAYLDDILMPSVTFEDGLEALREVFSLFRDAGMTFRLSKCQFFKERLEYLGHELSVAGIQPGQQKTRRLANTQDPRTYTRFDSSSV
jgi:Retroviral aspartyl protease./Reverse transcriptase (RNA-dependent DNA polymerase).